jgi:hypothetical protein
MKWYIAWSVVSLADRRQHAERVAGEEDDVVRVTATQGIFAFRMYSIG